MQDNDEFICSVRTLPRIRPAFNVVGRANPDKSPRETHFVGDRSQVGVTSLFGCVNSSPRIYDPEHALRHIKITPMRIVIRSTRSAVLSGISRTVKFSAQYPEFRGAPYPIGIGRNPIVNRNSSAGTRYFSIGRGPQMDEPSPATR